MIDRKALLSDLQSLLKRLEADLLERSESADVPDVGQALRTEYDRAKQAERTAQNYEDWRSDAITQAAAAWVLSCVFVRFLEDNKLIDPPKIAGPKERLQQARDEHTLYFQDSERAKLTDREYLLSVFDELAKLPGTKDVFGEHNPIRELPNWLSGDAAGELLRFFQKIEANSGDLIHDFTDPEWDTRFLGDLYQDLSESARKKYALLQTPEFVEEFILDRTLDPALDEFGLDAPPVTDRQNIPFTDPGFRMIDPACGSGHFLLGAFPRILNRWQKQEPGGKIRDHVQRTLDCIHGVDVNPYAIAIARFRLLLKAMKASGINRLSDAPGFRFNLACGDSLLHAPLRGGQQVFDWELTSDDAECEHAYQSEDLADLKRMLRSGLYHAVVANPPYITPKDRQLNQRYRKRFEACHMKYSLAVPFLERIFRMAVASGFTGQITSNSFMKREFGKKLIEQLLPQLDLTHVIDTSGAYIPGHGTPTVILFGQHRSPSRDSVRTVMGIRGEPRTPDDPSQGEVWNAIVNQIDQPGSQSEFVSVGDSLRELFHCHPWSIGGGGAAELKEGLDEVQSERLGKLAIAIGISAVTGEDELFMQPTSVLRRMQIEMRRPLIEGDVVRDWTFTDPVSSIWMYGDDFQLHPLESLAATARLFWKYRAAIYWRKRFGTPLVERGLKWYEWQELYSDKLRTPLSIVFAFVATHNHFVLDRGGKVFNRSAPVIKLPEDATEEDHLGLLGILNSSTACFWMKQIFHDKGSTVDSTGARQTTVAFENFREFTGTGLKKFPLPSGRPESRAFYLDARSRKIADNLLPGVLLAKGFADKASLDGYRKMYFEMLQQMISDQEELDWECYNLYDLVESDLRPSENAPPITLGERAFEIVLARKMAEGEAQTTWFERHGSTPITELPSDWPEDYKRLVERRIELIEIDRNIGLIEQPEYKRRWNTEPWDSQLERACRQWLLGRLESYFDSDGRMNETGKSTAQLDFAMSSIAKIADIAGRDETFLEVGQLYRDDAAFDVQRLVEELVAAEHVPVLPILRYKAPGVRKRKEWEKTWELQRQEDAIDTRTQLLKDEPQYLTEDQARDLKQREIGDIPVPPKYKSSDFISTGGARYWALRGKLDVPKERWVSFPHCEGPDGTLVIAWAGYDHLQLARAISAYFVDIQERLGGRDDPRLVPLLACIIELLPWLKQWHHDLDPDYNQRMDEVFEGFITEEAKNLGLTIDEIKAWQPPKRTSRAKKA
ncbi:BREX-2 system adenine-specific DNA-methyltransferase PglX [Lignipirellula cremea]|uniref:site-specific DNA-methyltransferase (adenine-specific) n=1 Tax=Lignipirellula cremea TaxID=2528010 RepID=A0A518E3X1_9BACT|nr:BREX-2 system adenine-specific DNA-methyltransferase PglX [Lignipirellula cremea]QDU98789.1 Type IIS restriction enzyme Eco57I [Lignipirellula cremea]